MEHQPVRNTSRQALYERLIQWWWVRLPIRVARLFPTLGSGLSDGLYLIHWTVLAAIAPPAAMILGILLGILHPGETFSTSSLVMALMIAVGMMSANLGAWAVAGYAIGDFFLHGHPIVGGGLLESLLLVRAPLVLSYFLLALPVVIVPLIVTSARLRIRLLRLPVLLRGMLEVLTCVVLSAVLVYMWAIAAAVLIRPIYTWRGDQPPTEAILPLQEHGWILACVAAVVVIARIFLEERAKSLRVATMANILAQALRIISGRRGRLGLGRPLRLLAGAAGLTLLMAGMISNLLEGLVVFVFLALLLWARSQLQRWSGHRIVARVPILIRFAAGLALGYLLGQLILTAFWGQTDGFEPVLLATCLSVAIVTLFTAIDRPQASG